MLQLVGGRQVADWRAGGPLPARAQQQTPPPPVTPQPQLQGTHPMPICNRGASHPLELCRMRTCLHATPKWSASLSLPCLGLVPHGGCIARRIVACAGAVSAVDLYRTHLAARRIVTFSSDLDRVLGGGVFTGQVTEFCECCCSWRCCCCCCCCSMWCSGQRLVHCAPRGYYCNLLPLYACVSWSDSVT